MPAVQPLRYFAVLNVVTGPRLSDRRVQQESKCLFSRCVLLSYCILAQGKLVGYSTRQLTLKSWEQAKKASRFKGQRAPAAAYGQHRAGSLERPWPAHNFFRLQALCALHSAQHSTVRLAVRDDVGRQTQLKRIPRLMGSQSERMQLNFLCLKAELQSKPPQAKWFIVLSVCAGVFCQSAIDSAQNDHATVVQSILANKKAHVEKIQALFSQFDDRETGVITFAMLEEKIDSPDVREYFETLGLDVWDAWSFFKPLVELWQRALLVPQSRPQVTR